MRLKDIPDMERYLYEDCYCPGEIYDISGFFFRVFKGDNECKLIYDGKDYRDEKDRVVMVVCDDQIINFWINRETERIYAAERYDATENNIRNMPKLIGHGKKFDLDEFRQGSTKKHLKEIFEVADAIVV